MHHCAFCKNPLGPFDGLERQRRPVLLQRILCRCRRYPRKVYYIDTGKDWPPEQELSNER